MSPPSASFLPYRIPTYQLGWPIPFDSLIRFFLQISLIILLFSRELLLDFSCSVPSSRFFNSRLSVNLVKCHLTAKTRLASLQAPLLAPRATRPLPLPITYVSASRVRPAFNIVVGPVTDQHVWSWNGSSARAQGSQLRLAGGFPLHPRRRPFLSPATRFGDQARLDHREMRPFPPQRA